MVLKDYFGEDKVWSTDLINRGYNYHKDTLKPVELDFLSGKLITPKADLIITNPPFSIKNKIFERCIELNKPFCLLMSATSIQSASFVKVISKEKNFGESIIEAFQKHEIAKSV
jgi:type I restriction-modification system DNA methylase subunit